MKLTVLLPGLAWPDADTLAAATDGLVLPELSWLLARAARTPLEQDADQVLAQQFGLGYTPVARVAGLADGLETRQGYWLRIDPVYLRAEREALVLAASAGGASTGEIAGAVHLSEGTVRNYLSAAIGKLGARNRAEALRSATDNGWI